LASGWKRKISSCLRQSPTCKVCVCVCMCVCVCVAEVVTTMPHGACV
jgi:hypothetical protein